MFETLWLRTKQIIKSWKNPEKSLPVPSCTRHNPKKESRILHVFRTLVCTFSEFWMDIFIYKHVK